MPIPRNPSKEFFKQNGIPGVGELMYASFPLSEQFADVSLPFDSWWLGEKYDGVRACWNGASLYSRYGLALSIPSEQVDLFHGLSFLDCEMWFGRGSFSEAQKIITQYEEESSNDWSTLRSIGFDNASPSYRFTEFEYRYKWIMDSISPHHPFVALIDSGGEGIVLRKPKSFYTSGRSQDLLKLKASRGDLEVLTVAVHSDKSLTLRMPSGVTFEVGPESILPTLSPQAGSVVSVSFENYSRRDVPTNPFVERVRLDLTWENVLQSHLDSTAQFLDDSSSKVLRFTSKPSGYWKESDNSNMRSFFENYAKERGWDPLVAQNWYSVRQADIVHRQGGRGVLSNFQGSLRKALVSLFPNIGLDVSKFDVVHNRYWHDMSNRKLFFDTYAKVNEFDPLLAQHWYSISYKQLLNQKGAWSVLCYYDNIHAALSHVYPNIGLDERKFKISPRNYWKDTDVRRQFFIDYAKRNNFDPRVASNWYQISRAHFTFEKGALTMLQLYKGNLATALQDLFPDTPFDPSKFTRSPDAFWKDDMNKRKLFIHFAHERGFDPLVPSNWYSIPPADIENHKAAKIVLSFFRGKSHRALMALFPSLDWDARLFRPSKQSYWQDVTNRKKFFEMFAKERGFEPLVASNWYPIPFNSLWCRKGAISVLQYSLGSFAAGLCEIFPNIGLDPSKFIELSDPAKRQYDRRTDILPNPTL